MTATPKPINYELLHRLTVEKCSVLEVCAGLEISEATYYNRKKNNPVFLAAVEAAQSNCTWEKALESMEEVGHPPAEPEKQKRPRKPRPDLNESYLKAIGAEDFPSGEHQAVYINLNSWIFYAIKEGYLTATMISKFWLTDDMCIDLTYTLEMMLATYNYMFDIGELVTREKANMTCYLQRDNIPHNFYLKDGKFVMLWTEDDARIGEDNKPMVKEPADPLIKQAPRPKGLQYLVNSSAAVFGEYEPGGTKHKGYEDFSRPAPTTAADREFYETEVKPAQAPNGFAYFPDIVAKAQAESPKTNSCDENHCSLDNPMTGCPDHDIEVMADVTAENRARCLKPAPAEPPVVLQNIDLIVWSNGKIEISAGGELNDLTFEVLKGLVEIKNRCEGNNVA